MADYGKSRGLLDYISKDDAIRKQDKKYRGLFGLDPKVSGREQPSLYRDVGGEMQSLWDDTMAMMPMGGSTFYHASPNRFQQFSNEFNLMGEGANAYGRGHYLAQKFGVGMEYLRDLAKGGKWHITDKAKKKYQPQIDKVDESIKKLEKWYKDKRLPVEEMMSKRHKMQKHREYLDTKMKLEGGKMTDASGYLYKVDVPEHKIGDMIDWDKNIASQKGVLNKIDPERTLLDKASRWRASEKAPREYKLYPKVDAADVTGEDFIKYLQRNKKMKGRFDLEDYLKSRGVPGVKYLDAGSRPTVSNWKPASKTSNVVVFDPKDIRIKATHPYDSTIGLLSGKY